MAVQTPFYHYDIELLENTLQTLTAAIPSSNFKVHYAIKANAEPRILQTIRKYGLGADCVSGNEITRALECGYAPSEIVLAGVGKSDAELNTAISNGIHSINCESIEELEVINEIAEQNNRVAHISFRINPNVDAKTHHKITTGLSENKFGIPISEVSRAIAEIRKMNALKLTGVHFHIGSQILSMDPFIKLCTQVNTLLDEMEAEGVELEHINVGGGLGIDYLNPDGNPIPDFEKYFAVFHEHLQVRPGQTVHFELGRSVVAQCGSLISKVLYVKKGATKNFAIIDAGMTELIRPALYDSHHEMENITADAAMGMDTYSVVGPICESSDVFGQLEMPITKRGDIIKIKSAGAYGQVLSSNYNLRDSAIAYYSDEMTLNACIGKEEQVAIS
ncbi:diaminopimelate decarboxylase [Reichenbachiella agarivorans]|uniref:Diaminopimelate decarboxylase n=1 Tax=Reichenbachiella agarivorans TaxID=2979464 RepID=A0ABY6CQT8_9BACT|nr:diaminopimelate decarboxylase [Reichenbachiella agarivorans]UXP32891.1 diaminopimelate decarboxylase [Reichenbachiella agarivorans]